MHYKAIIGKDRVLVGNPEVLKQILVTNVYNYTKPPATALEYAVGGRIHEYFSLIFRSCNERIFFTSTHLFSDYELTHNIFYIKRVYCFPKETFTTLTVA